MIRKCSIFLLFLLFFSVFLVSATEIELDLKFTSDPNSVNLVGGGVVPFVLFGNADTNFTKSNVLLVRVDWKSVPVSSYRINAGDENGDGYTDVKVFVKKSWLRTILIPEQTRIVLAVHTTDAVWYGRDSIRIVKF